MEVVQAVQHGPAPRTSYAVSLRNLVDSIINGHPLTCRTRREVAECQRIVTPRPGTGTPSRSLQALAISLRHERRNGERPAERPAHGPLLGGNGHRRAEGSQWSPAPPRIRCREDMSPCGGGVWQNLPRRRAMSAGNGRHLLRTFDGRGDRQPLTSPVRLSTRRGPFESARRSDHCWCQEPAAEMILRPLVRVDGDAQHR